jgi:hypothetical protein
MPVSARRHFRIMPSRRLKIACLLARPSWPNRSGPDIRKGALACCGSGDPG